MYRIPLGLVAAAACAGTATGETVGTTDQRIAELTDLVTDLRSEVALLRKEAGDDEWLTEERARELRGLVEDVLADADQRTSLLQGAGIGYDGGFTLGGDGFSMKINGQVQFRYVYNQQDNSPAGSGADDNVAGFEARRTKLKFKGNVLDDTWGYGLVGAFEDTLSSDGELELEEVEISKKLGNGWMVRIGQIKGPFMREELVSSTSQTAAERSLVNERFNQDRAQGIEVSWKQDQLRWAVMWGDGFPENASAGGQLGQTRNTGWFENNREFAIAGRVEYLASGDWGQFKDFAGWPGGEMGLLVGGALMYQRAAYGTATANEFDDLRLTADVSLEMDGANVFAAFVYQTLDDHAAVDEDNWGFVVQGGYFMTDDVELFVRYELGEDDRAGVPGIEDLSVITFGFNKYWAKNGLKWTTDLGFAFNQVDPRWATTSAGWRGDAVNEDGQTVVRSQIQLTF